MFSQDYLGKLIFLSKLCNKLSLLASLKNKIRENNDHVIILIRLKQGEYFLEYIFYNVSKPIRHKIIDLLNNLTIKIFNV